MACLAEEPVISLIAFDDTHPSTDSGGGQRGQRLLTIQGYRTVVIYSMITFAPTFIVPFNVSVVSHFHSY
jgi:hypothetical protein